MGASPTFGDVKPLNKLARQIKSQPVKLQFWPLKLQFWPLFLMPPTEITKEDLHREACQRFWQNRVSDRQKTGCRMESN